MAQLDLSTLVMDVIRLPPKVTQGSSVILLNHSIVSKCTKRGSKTSERFSWYAQRYTVGFAQNLHYFDRLLWGLQDIHKIKWPFCPSRKIFCKCEKCAYQMYMQISSVTALQSYNLWHRDNARDSTQAEPERCRLSMTGFLGTSTVSCMLKCSI